MGMHRYSSIACLCALVVLQAACSRGAAPEVAVAEARSLVASGKSADARIVLKNSLQAYPSSVEARVLLAQIALDAGNVRAASDEIGKVDFATVTDARSVRTVIEVDIASGAIDRARERLSARAALLGPSVAVVLSARASRAGGAAVAAVAELRDAHERDGNDDEVTLELASVLYDAGDRASADRLVSGLLSKKPQSPDALMTRGSFRARAGNFGAAADDFTAAIEAAPPDWPGASLAAALVQQAESQLSAGRLAAAKASIDRLQQGFPGITAASLLRSRLAVSEGRTAEAVTELRKLATAFPSDQRIELALAEALERNGNAVQSEAILAKRLALAAGDDSARAMLAGNYLRSGRPDKAARLYERLPARLAGNVAEFDADPAIRAKRAVAAARQAVTVLSKLQQQAPEDAKLQRDLAVALAASGDPAAALALARGWPSDDVSPQVTAARLALAIAAPDESLATDVLQRLAAAKDVTADAFVAAIELAGSASRSDLVAKLATEASRRFPANAAIAVRHASVVAQDLGLAKALELIEDVRKRHPQDPTAAIVLSGLYARDGKQEQAESTLQEYISKHPDQPSASLAQARLQLARQDTARAREVLDRMVAGAKDPGGAANAAGQVLLAGRDVEGARGMFASATRVAADRVDYQLNLARAELLLGDREAAAKALPLLGGNDAEVASVARVTLPLLLAAGKVERAAVAARALVAAEPDNPISWFLSGEVAIRQQRWKEADSALARSQALYPTAETALRQHVVRLSGRLNDPEKSLAEALEINGLSVPVLNAMASYQLGTGSLAEAKSHLETLLKLDPANVAALNNLAWVLAETAPAEALPLASRARAIAPANPAVADTLGWALHRLGRPKEALKHVEFAANGLPKEPGVQYHLAVVRAALGQSGEASAALDRALAHRGDFHERGAALKLKGELQ
jgi:putative PEP-CTERM system TPR-repeat lipoprotein